MSNILERLKAARAETELVEDAFAPHLVLRDDCGAYVLQGRIRQYCSDEADARELAEYLQKSESR